MEGQGRILDVVVGEELCGVACCLGSGIVVLKYSAIQRLKREIKQDTDRQTDRQTDTNAFRFSNTINRVRL